MKKKIVKSETQKQIEKMYRNNRKRIQSYIREAKKYSVVVPEDILPERPKKITEASVRRLEKITKRKFGELLAKKGGYRITTGEMFLDYYDYRKFIKEQKEVQKWTLDTFTLLFDRIRDLTNKEIMLLEKGKKAEFYELHDDIIYLQEIMEKHAEEKDYNRYLRENEDRITEQLERLELKILYAEQVVQSVAILAYLLNRGNAGLNLERLNDITESINNYYAEEF